MFWILFFVCIIPVSSEKHNMCLATCIHYYTEWLHVLEVPVVLQTQKWNKWKPHKISLFLVAMFVCFHSFGKCFIKHEWTYVYLLTCYLCALDTPVIVILLQHYSVAVFWKWGMCQNTTPMLNHDFLPRFHNSSWIKILWVLRHRGI